MPSRRRGYVPHAGRDEGRGLKHRRRGLGGGGCPSVRYFEQAVVIAAAEDGKPPCTRAGRKPEQGRVGAGSSWGSGLELMLRRNADADADADVNSALCASNEGSSRRE